MTKISYFVKIFYLMKVPTLYRQLRYYIIPTEFTYIIPTECTYIIPTEFTYIIPTEFTYIIPT